MRPAYPLVPCGLTPYPYHVRGMGGFCEHVQDRTARGKTSNTLFHQSIGQIQIQPISFLFSIERIFLFIHIPLVAILPNYDMKTQDIATCGGGFPVSGATLNLGDP